MDVDYSVNSAKDYTINRVIQFICLGMTFFASSFYNNRSAVIEIANIMGGQIDARFVITTMIMSAILVTGFYYLGIKIIYSIADKIYKNQVMKELMLRPDLHNTIEQLPTLPIRYDTLKWEISWVVVIINILVGLVRVLYFYAPYSIGIIEAVVPAIVNVGAMAIYYHVRLRNRYLDDNNRGYVFVSLIVPYVVFMIIFV